MNEAAFSNAGESSERVAARWALRCADGLSRRDEAALAQWLAADPGHARLLADYRGAWGRFEPLAAATLAGIDADGRRALREDRPRAWRWVWPAVTAMAAAIVIVFYRAPDVPTAVAHLAAAEARLPPPCEQQTLPDGTVVELNRGAELAVEFSAAIRRVRLIRGEASFAVAKNPQRPFVVVADGVEARAIGTAFNVSHGGGGVEVLVTEGTVKVDNPGSVASAPVESFVLNAGQQVAVGAGTAAGHSAVTTLTPAQVQARLRWQPRLLEFDDAPLAEIVRAFNQRNPVELVIGDPALAAQRMTATFRSDNVESFVRLLETNYGIRLRRGPDGLLRLSRR
ncbi:FecR family protein [Horticoccus sp. 23ND18S-11]|uniref:FecR family protein n=1 Tax=Horticoccus sp. 23ND18S-11 TaxID=3391832 RepID=UPI0039C933BE